MKTFTLMKSYEPYGAAPVAVTRTAAAETRNFKANATKCSSRHKKCNPGATLNLTAMLSHISEAFISAYKWY